MSANDNANGSKIATIVTTAAVTLAVGVTVAAFGGYLAPGRPTRPQAKAEVAVTASPQASEQPTVILVPVSQTPSEQTERDFASGPSPEPLLAAAPPDRERDEDEHEHRSGHHEREDDD